MNVVKGSIKIFPILQRGTVEKEVQIYCLTTAGFLHGRHQLAKISGKRRRSECLMNFFLVRIPCIETLFII